jgi:Chaperone of endosialidase
LSFRGRLVDQGQEAKDDSYSESKSDYGKNKIVKIFALPQVRFNRLKKHFLSERPVFPLNNTGFALAPILYLLALVGVGAGVLFSGYHQILRTNVEITRDNATKNELSAASRVLSASAKLSEDSTRLCLPNSGTESSDCDGVADLLTGMTLFASVVDTDKLPSGYASASSAGTPYEVGVFAAGSGMKLLDPWGHYYIYCRWESTISSGSSMAMQLMSAGSDGTLDTDCGDTTPAVDDYIERVTVAEAIDRANVWQQVTESGQSVVKYGGPSNPVKVKADGTVEAVALSVSGNGSIGGNLTVTGSLTAGSTSISSISTTGNASIGGTLGVTGATTLSSTLGVTGATTLSSTLGVTGATTLSSTLGVTGATTLSSTLDVTGATTLAALSGTTASFSGAVSLGSTLDVAGATTLSTLAATTATLQVLTVSGSGGGSLLVQNLATVGSLASGNASITGTLGVSGASTLANLTGSTATFTALNVTGNSIMGGNLNVTGTVTAGGFSGNLTGNVTGNVTGNSDTATTITTTLPVNKGGTGATTPLGARTNLGTDDAGNITTGTLDIARIADASITNAKLVDSGVTSGAYNWGTVNAKGIVTFAQNVTVGSISQDNTSITVTDTGTDGTVTITTEGVARLTVDPTGNVGIGTTSPQEILHIVGNMRIQGAAGSDRDLQWTSGATSKRWALRTNSTAEGGSNAGSDFVLKRYDDSGAALTDALTITRSNAAAVFAGQVTAGGFVGNLTGNVTGNVSGNVTGSISLSDGSAAAPSLFFTSDTDTGLYRVGSDSLGFTTGGTNRLTINSGGYAGLGASTTSATLTLGTLAGGGGYGLQIVGPTDNNWGGGINLISNNGTTTEANIRLSTGGLQINNTKATPIRLFTSNTERLRIDELGNVGIGTTTINDRLVVVDSTAKNGTVRFGDDPTYYGRASYIFSTGEFRIGQYGGGSLGLTFYTNSTERLRIDASGNVGIGTTSPTNALSFGGNSARTLWMERHTTSDTAGNNLTVQSGGATSLATNRNGGNLLLSSGISTGTGTSTIQFLTASAGASGTSDNTPAARMTILGSGNVGIGTTNPGYPLEVVGNTYIGGNLTVTGTISGTLSGNISLADGNATNPGLYFTNDTNTGIYRSGNDNFDITTGGTQRVNVSSTGLNITGTGFLSLGGTQVLRTLATSNLLVGNTGAASTLTGTGTSTGGNTLVGVIAGQGVTTGYYNTIMGYAAGYSNTTGYQNTFLGYGAGYRNVGAINATAVGSSAMFNFTASGETYNTAVGSYALQGGSSTNSTGTWNTAVGYNAAGATTTAQANTAIGNRTLANVTTGGYNTAVGSFALNSNQTGTDNAVLGRDAMFTATSGDNNVVVGSTAMYRAVNTSQATAVGTSALFNFTVSGISYNTAIGYRALFGGSSTNSTGTYNTALGYTSGYSTTTAQYSTLIGAQAGYNLTSGGSNTAIGVSALYGGSSTNSTGANNVAIGVNAGYFNTTGTNNVFIGRDAAMGNTGGIANAALGAGALASNTAGQYNTAIGFRSLYYMATTSTTSTLSTALGAWALYGGSTTNTVGVENTALGYYAGYGITTGGLNTLVGSYAGQNLASGFNNVMMGRSAGASVTSGSNNILLGYAAGSTTLATGSTNILIGYAVDTPASGTSNFLNIGGDIFGDLTNVLFKIGGSVAVPTANAILDLSAGTGATNSSLLLPQGTTGNRPTSSTTGMFRYNTSTNNLEYFHATLGWSAVATTGATSGTIQLADGSAGTPSLTFTNDTDTGLYRSGSDNIDITTGGTQRVNVSSSGINITNGGYLRLNGVNGLLFSATNLLVGDTSANSTLSGTNNVLIGKDAGDILDGGSRNIFIGTSAGATQVAGLDSVAIGYLAMAGFENTGLSDEEGRNVAIGSYALEGVYPSTGYYNVAIGYQAGAAVTTGQSNVFVGYRAGASAAGSSSTLVGFQAGASLVTGINNTFIGSQTGTRAVNTSSSTAVGSSAMLNFTVSGTSYNTALGTQALYGGSSTNSTGNSNTALGYNTGYALLTGANNTFVGDRAGDVLTTGSSNIMIGKDAGGTTLTTGSSNILIGNSTDTPASSTSNFINIGNIINGLNAGVSTYAVGLNMGTTTPSYPLQVGTTSDNGNGAYLTAAGVWTNISDRRIKDNIRPIEHGLDDLMKLQPVNYEVKGSGEKQVGFIAQDVAAIVPEVVSYDDKQDKYGMSYGNLVAVAVKAVQELKVENDKLREEIRQLTQDPASSGERLSSGSPDNRLVYILMGMVGVLFIMVMGLGIYVLRNRK